MAESTLSLEYSDFQAEVGYLLGFGRDPSGWDADTVSLVSAIIQTGVRWFYYPQAVPGLSNQRMMSHQWSFLRPVTTITMVTAYSTGTVSSAAAVVTLTGGVFPSWSATHGTITVDNTTYQISSRDSDTQITLTETPGTAFSADTYVVDHDGNYDAPDDYGGIDGMMTFAPEAWENAVTQVPEGLIRRERQQTVADGPPRWYAIRPKEIDPTVGQRFEFMFYPPPDEAYVLTYRYVIHPNILTTTNKYPYGGMAHAETIQQACLAAAELRAENERGAQWQEFTNRLTASIMADRDANTAQFLGHNGDSSVPQSGGWCGGRASARLSENYYTTYQGQLPS